MAATKKEQQQRLSPEEFNKLQMQARAIVSGELQRNNIAVDVRLLTTISILSNTAIKFLQEELSKTEARESFNRAMAIYLNNDQPF